MPETIGLVGTGIMGAPMARNLAKAGFHVIVHNRTLSRAAALKDSGIEIAASLADLGRRASIAVIMVPDTPDVLQVVEGSDGLIHNMAPGTVIIDMSTISPSETRALARRLFERGIAMLDAPVSGGSWGAEQGTLSIMVGGDPDVFQRCLPLFRAMGTNINLMGTTGTGQTTKLVNQILVAGTCLAVAEALVFAETQGIDSLATIEAVSGGAAGSWQLSNLGPRMVNRDFAPGFMVKLQQKDLRLVQDQAEISGSPVAIAGLAREYLSILEADGYGSEGTQAIIKAVQKIAGMTARNQEDS